MIRQNMNYANTNDNNGFNIDEFLYALCIQFLNSILDRKYKCDDDFNGALDIYEMRYALDILNVKMTEEHYNLMFENADDAGVKGLDDNYSIQDTSDTESSSSSDDDDDDIGMHGM